MSKINPLAVYAEGKGLIRRSPGDSSKWEAWTKHTRSKESGKVVLSPDGDLIGADYATGDEARKAVRARVAAESETDSTEASASV